MKRFVDVIQILAIVASIVFVIALFANDASTGGGGGGGGGGEVTAGGTPDGAAIFAGNCASCHGSDGGGGAGPQLSDGEVVTNFPDPADQIAVVTDGRGNMPSFEDRLSPEEIEAVVTFTREELG